MKDDAEFLAEIERAGILAHRKLGARPIVPNNLTPFARDLISISGKAVKLKLLGEDDKALDRMTERIPFSLIKPRAVKAKAKLKARYAAQRLLAVRYALWWLFVPQRWREGGRFVNGVVPADHLSLFLHPPDDEHRAEAEQLERELLAYLKAKARNQLEDSVIELAEDCGLLATRRDRKVVNGFDMDALPAADPDPEPELNLSGLSPRERMVVDSILLDERKADACLRLGMSSGHYDTTLSRALAKLKTRN
jgi:hypothetical protein